MNIYKRMAKGLFLILFLIGLSQNINAEKVNLSGNLSDYNAKVMLERNGVKYYYIETSSGIGVIDSNMNLIVPFTKSNDNYWVELVMPKYNFFNLWYSPEGKNTNPDSETYAVFDITGRKIIKEGRYNFVSPLSYNYLKVVKNKNNKKLSGLCDKNGNEIVAPQYADIKVENNKVFAQQTANGSWREISLTPSPSPDRIDNTEKIRKQEQYILSLKEKKRKCYSCKGTGQVRNQWCFSCKGTGSKKVGNPPQFFPCQFCDQTGWVKKSCTTCDQTNVAIGIAENLLKSLKDTHGMTKEQAVAYYRIKSEDTQMQLEYQKEIDNIYNSHVDKTRTSNSNSNSNTNSTSVCQYCGGTGYDKYADESIGLGPKPTATYVNFEGKKCPVCSKFTWHQHIYCPHCRSDKYR